MATDDIVEIEQLLYRYCFLLDSGSAEEVAALFSETAVLVPTYSGEAPASGRAAILQWYVDYQTGTRGAVNHLRHVVTNPMIEVSGDQATAQCYLTANAVSKATGKASWTAGLYQDKLVREAGRWRFAERRIVIHYATESEPR
jgi:3-phenylpropionate/cinnamic acid dioxygenase small subunit